MLLELRIENVATVEQLTIEFGPGFSALTGETGAGKSIIIEAVGLVLGERAAVDLIRTGSEKAVVEAIFSLADEAARPRVRELLEDDEESGDLIIRREILQNGRSKALVNGRGVPVTLLTKLRPLLVEIHGQHEYQVLLDAKRHVDFIDAFGALLNQRAAVEETYQRYQVEEKALASFQEQAAAGAHRRELLTFQRTELQAARLQFGELDRLELERVILGNTERLAAGVSAIFTDVYEQEGSIYERLAGHVRELGRLSALDVRLQAEFQTLEELVFRLEDVTVRLRDYGSNLQSDPKRLLEIEDRIFQLHDLQRKYHKDIPQLLDYLNQILAELAQQEVSGEQIRKLEHSVATTWSELIAQAQALSARRKQVARELKAAIERELSDLGMDGAIFECAFSVSQGSDRFRMNPHGLDQVEFIMSANPGEDLRSLARIASGGELSRIMLALKHLFVLIDKTPTLIFDEIDSGISGQTAESVGRKLASIAHNHQVLCVTHLPHIAAMTDHHYLVYKEVVHGRTLTSVKRLSYEDRKTELARMLEGDYQSSLTRDYVASLLKRLGTKV